MIAPSLRWLGGLCRGAFVWGLRRIGWCQPKTMRDPVCTQAAAVHVTGKARQHLPGFLLRHGQACPGKKGLTKAHPRRLTTVGFPHPAERFVLQDHIHSISAVEVCGKHLTDNIAVLLPGQSLGTNPDWPPGPRASQAGPTLAGQRPIGRTMGSDFACSLFAFARLATKTVGCPVFAIALSRPLAHHPTDNRKRNKA